MNASVWAAVAAAFVMTGVRAATVPEAPHPAVWSQHALIVDLPNLPRHYTCNELWYKFRDVLFSIGARPDMKVLPYRCESVLAGRAYSPKVELVFSTPREVSGKDVQWADMKAVRKSIQFAPGEPSHLDDRDCDLVKAMKSTLLRSIGVHIDDYRLACRAPPTSGASFALTIDTLVPVTATKS